MAAVVPVALGIAATTTLFSVVHGVLLRPLPYAHADRLVRIAERPAGDGGSEWSSGSLRRETFDAWKAEGKTIDGLFGFSRPLRTLRTGGEPKRLQVSGVTADAFELLGARPARGRFFQPGEDRSRADVAVLSYDLWVSRFGGDAGILGQSITLDERAYTVVGIAERTFYFPDRKTELWIAGVGDEVIARVRPGATVQDAIAEASAISHRVSMQPVAASDGHEEAPSPRRAVGIGLLDESTRSVRRALLVMMGAAIVVLLVASANAANLLLVRAFRRGRELAVRAALGGSARRIARELFVDSLVIGGIAGSVGVLLAVAAHRVLVALLPRDFPRLQDIAMDWWVVAFGAGVSMVVIVAAGLAPTLKAFNLNLNQALHAIPGTAFLGRRRAGSPRFGSAVVAVEVALCCALLICAGLLTRSFAALSAVEKGYDPTNVLTVQVTFSSTAPQAKRRDQTVALLERIARTPPVLASGITNALPLEAVHVRFVLGDGPGKPPTASMEYRVVSPGYFDAAGMRLATGRGFDGTETPASQPVAIVNESFVRKYSPTSPVEQFKFPADAQGRRYQIIGVVKDIRDHGPSKPSPPVLYRSYLQVVPTYFNRIDLVVRTPEDPLAFMPALRGIVKEVDPTLALYLPATMEEHLEQAMARPRLYSVTLLTFAGFVLAIIGSGLFGMLAYTVAQRRREIAVRMALGASIRHVLSAVLGRMAGWTILGIAGGVAGGVVLSRLLAGLIFGIAPLDPLTFLAAPCIVALVALLAALAPLRRALRVQLASVLRAD